MLAKCANPACSARFRYFHEGQLFAVESRIDSLGTGRPADSDYAGRPKRVRYFWLCRACCSAMTFRRDGDGGISVVRNTRPSASMMGHNTEMAA